MLQNPHFYNRTIRKIVIAFGTMFNDIEVIRYMKDGTAKERFKVPLSFGPKEKYLTRILSDPTLTKSIATTLPRITFNLEGVNYDTSRKQVTTLRNFSNSDNVFKSQYVPIPYDFTFTMSILVRNIEDGTQIIEQILPFFTPDFTVTVDFISSMEKKYDMPVILNSVSTSTEFEGDLLSTRVVVWDLEFTAKAYIWPAVRSDGNNGKYIRYANGNIYDTANNKLAKIMVTPDPLNAEPNGEYDFNTDITEYFDGKYGSVNISPLPGVGVGLYDTPEPSSLGLVGVYGDPGGGMDLDGYSLSQGLYRKKYDGYFNGNVDWFKGRQELHGLADTSVCFATVDNDDTFSMEWLGYFKPPTTGYYNFWLVSANASYMWIGQNALSGFTRENATVDNGDDHTEQWSYNVDSKYLDSSKYYPIRVRMGNNVGSEMFQMFYALVDEYGSRNFNTKLYYNNITLGF